MSSTRLTRGIRVGDRYRLERELGHGADGTTWEAVDERLDRPVALRLFAPGTDRTTIVRRAGLAASLTHPRVVRVFDTGEDEGRFFTVSELVPESLQTARRPLPPDVALSIATQIAEALQYAHERGVVHGNLHEGNVLLSEGGAKVGDFALSLTNDGGEVGDDLRQLGELLRRVCRVPEQPATSGLGRVIEGLSSEGYGSASDVLRDLRDLRPPQVRAVRRTPRRGWLVILVALLLLVAAFGVMRLGEQTPGQRLVPGGKITEGTRLTVRVVDDFDPEGDGSESQSTVRNVIDRDPQTFWSTERYSSAPDFSALAKPKTGVGVLLDLQRPTEIAKAQVLFAAPGCSFELRHSDNTTAPVREWAESAKVTKSPASAALEFDGAGDRYWLVWITRLTTGMPGAGEKFACAIKEIDLFAP